MAEINFLKDNVRNIQKIIVLPPLAEFEIEDLKKSLRLSRIREYEHGEIILEAGEGEPYIYFLLSGKARINKKNTQSKLIDHLGEIFSEIDVLKEFAHSNSVYAEGNKTVCLVVHALPSNRITSDQAADILLLLYRIFMEYIAIRLRLINDKLVKLKKESEGVKEKNKK